MYELKDRSKNKKIIVRDAEELFDKIDVNHDGKLSIEEVFSCCLSKIYFLVVYRRCIYLLSIEDVFSCCVFDSKNRKTVHRNIKMCAISINVIAYS